jgi:hypothetical protein
MRPKLTFKDIMDFAFAKAIADKLTPTDESLYRFFCRRYSELFHTSLADVFAMDPFEVVQHVYEHQLDKEDTEENVERYLETIYSIEDPEYQAKEDQDLSDFIEQAKEDEAQRIAEGRPIHKAIKDETTLVPEPPKNLPKSGYIDLSYLEKEEQ